ncbi:MAG: hypothetical protein HY718_06485, partial [Planctomycetes bacterium]|nr:hypothetical protein [Planctomycetota bacterium]
MRIASRIVVLADAAVVLALASRTQANLLVNGGFEAGGASPCVAGWRMLNTSVPQNCKYDGTTHVPNPAVKEGLHRGSMDVNSPSAAEAHMCQTVTVAAGQPVRLTGWIAGGTTGPVYTYFARIHDGADLTGAVIASFETTDQGWQQVDITGTPAGTQVTVEYGFSGPALNWGIVATHGDAFDLTQENPVCTGEPTISGVNPGFGVSGTTASGVHLTGANFDNTCEVLLQAAGLPDIGALNESASVDGTTLTFDVPLAAAAMGKRNIVVTKPNCNGTTLSNGFVVALPSLTNGSFESPAAAASCPNPPTAQGAPDNWLQSGVSTAGSHLIRDSDQYPPGCPRPDGDHYGSIMMPVGVSFTYWEAYQYIAVTPSQQITVSGSFAGGGRTTVRLTLHDGDETGPELASRLIEQRVGCPVHVYDWVPASVSATPTQGFFTLRWSVGGQQGDAFVDAGHADNLVLSAGPPPAEICGNGLDDDGDRRIDCQDSDCAAEPACTPPPAEVCGDGIDNDGDLSIDCDDSDCAATCVEVCNNGIDDNGDCQVDEGCTEICDNGIDDNNN